MYYNLLDMTEWSSEEALKIKYDDDINKKLQECTLNILSSFGFHMLCLTVCFPVMLKVREAE